MSNASRVIAWFKPVMTPSQPDPMVKCNPLRVRRSVSESHLATWFENLCHDALLLVLYF